jgi:hypothetical protein
MKKSKRKKKKPTGENRKVRFKTGQSPMTRERMVQELRWLYRPRENSADKLQKGEQIKAWMMKAKPDWIPVVIDFMRFPPQKHEGTEGESPIVWDPVLTLVSGILAYRFTDEMLLALQDAFYNEGVRSEYFIGTLAGIKNQSSWSLLKEIAAKADELTSAQISKLSYAMRSLAEDEIAPLQDVVELQKKLLDTTKVKDDSNLLWEVTSYMDDTVSIIQTGINPRIEEDKRLAEWKKVRDHEAALKSGEVMMTREYMIKVILWLGEPVGIYRDINDIWKEISDRVAQATPDWVPILIGIAASPPEEKSEVWDEDWDYVFQLFLCGVVHKFQDESFTAIKGVITKYGYIPFLIDALGSIHTEESWSLLMKISSHTDELGSKQIGHLSSSLANLARLNIAPLTESIPLLERLIKLPSVQSDSDLLEEMTDDIEKLRQKTIAPPLNPEHAT